MASKRKSTVPCMIPSKSKHVREEIILGSLPELLPTIPEDSILSISGEDSGHFSHGSSRSESGSETQKGGTYGCVTCRFESRDLNYFLDHMHNCHLDFRAQPTFYCLNCGVSVVRFEALALHNANAHPKIMEGLVTASLSVNRRDGVTTVEQSLFADSGEDCRESGISFTKTPIAKMMKGKGEHKKIVVSHTVEVRKLDTGKDVDPSMLTNVPELQNGALSISGTPSMPRTAVSHVITTVSNQIFHQHTPSLYSPSSSSNCNKDLPKVMIPLSSIPTYDAAMDTSSFLKTSFGKFPYPTKAELCYLTVVSEFPEEQIKLWFTAQRLKQGISWSPEEIEEARRKMFNTVFQGGAPQKQPAPSRQVKNIVSHHTITAHPGARGPHFRMAKVPSGIKPPPVRVIATQASMSSNPNVTRLTYSTPVVSPKFPSVVRATQVTTQSTEATVEPERSNGLDVAGGVAGGNGSRSSSTNGVETNSNDGTATCSARISNNGEHCVPDANGSKPVTSDSLLLGSNVANSAAGPVIAGITSKPNNACNNHNGGGVSAAEPGHAERPDGELKPTPYTDSSGGVSEEPDSSCSDSTSNQSHASTFSTDSTSTTVITKSTSSSVDEGNGKEFPTKGMSILQQLIREEDPVVEDRGGPDLAAEPVKVSFRRLKRSEPETTSETVHEEHKSETDTSFSPPWGAKTPQQLHVLRQAFSSARWPSSLQYEELGIQTGLPKSEVVRWFSDSRYSHKNGQLKWLETYQRPAAESEGPGGPEEAEAKAPVGPPAAKKKLVEEDANKHLEMEAGLKSGLQAGWQDPCSPPPAPAGFRGRGEHDRAEESAQAGQGGSQDPWSQGAEDHQQPGASQSLNGQQADISQDRDRLRMELLEV
ncbi:zinc fingers and homeoboxes protein 3 [Cololabis saira]|uniref:zinc fingers and homeoboxes protein 3 n=1 Tax=Cololabis saira TaxID=129043 RepID=UPI002AD20A41|nr:zinc fingers and homeoboxes protein 3 [Cololabis saira]XP_061584028.1 zinc fingers and homeoboxes protein 3 [Cololabis saira]XP_061584029.1 zinc fingers and homeoboxes protein 3 [Cololabis saira]XP_061584030.1 zinc fingers and homeoboxes protein 3 [Cololabis saira]